PPFTGTGRLRGTVATAAELSVRALRRLGGGSRPERARDTAALRLAHEPARRLRHRSAGRRAATGPQSRVGVRGRHRHRRAVRRGTDPRRTAERTSVGGPLVVPTTVPEPTPTVRGSPSRGYRPRRRRARGTRPGGGPGGPRVPLPRVRPRPLPARGHPVGPDHRRRRRRDPCAVRPGDRDRAGRGPAGTAYRTAGTCRTDAFLHGARRPRGGRRKRAPPRAGIRGAA